MSQNIHRENIVACGFKSFHWHTGRSNSHDFFSLCRFLSPDTGLYLVGSLIGKVLGAALCAAKEKHSSTSLLVVNSAHMQRTIAGRIAAVHISTVEQQVFQVLDQAMPTGLRVDRVSGESQRMQQRCICQTAGYKVLASEFVLFCFGFVCFRVRVEEFQERRERER